jgi:multiple sugar transport system ATP-binding protein
MVVQDDALLPHLSAGGNMGFALRLRKMLGREVERRVADQARVLGLSELLERAPRTLSGGQQRATALGRALVRAPEVFLLDEPLARLDAGERARLRAELVTRVTRHGTTTILVTNDPVEAMAVGSRLAVLAGGRIAQVGRPQEVYDAPAGVAVAQLVGDPPMGLVEGVLEPGGRTCWVRVGTQRVRVAPPPHATRRRYEGATVHLGVRAEHARPGADLLGTVVHAAPTGAWLLVGIVLPGAPGSALQLRLAIGPVPHRGSAVAFALDPDALRLFDPLTGLALPRD